ncbi:MAG: Hsp20/alpha crystallin family protein [Chloroflexota bacterium]|nr:Hsp20/alpha crystallin family protein [Chloroflexota bacterium]
MVMRRWDPFIELRRMQDNMDYLWRGFVQPSSGNSEMEGWAIPLDVVQEGDNIVVHASLPGVNPSDLNVSIENDVLTIRGQTASDSERQEGNYLMRERHTGSFHRSLRLPDTLNVEKAQTSYDHGVLTVAFPKVEAKQARQLSINVGGGKQIVEGDKAEA